MSSLYELNQAYIKARYDATVEEERKKDYVVTMEEFKRMPLHEQNMLYLKHPEIYKACWKEIHADDL